MSLWRYVARRVLAIVPIALGVTFLTFMLIHLIPGDPALTILGNASAAGPAKVDDPSASIPLAPHRAVYDLKLGQLRGKRSLEAVRGRIVYDFNGNICDGYDLRFRQVTELDSGEGKSALSDLRSTRSWTSLHRPKFWPPCAMSPSESSRSKAVM